MIFVDTRLGQDCQTSLLSLVCLSSIISPTCAVVVYCATVRPRLSGPRLSSPRLSSPRLSSPRLSGSLAIRKKIVGYKCTAYATLHTVCVFDYPVPSPIRIFLWKTDVCGYARSDCTSDGGNQVEDFYLTISACDFFEVLAYL